MSMVALEPAFDAAHLPPSSGSRPNLGCVIATVDDRGPVGMTVGSFTSISLDPPLVGFFAAHASSSLARVLGSGHFSVNVLTDEQNEHCRIFAARDAGKFSGVAWHRSASGDPHLDDALAWVDCDVDSVLETGDHAAVIGRVRRLEIPPSNRKPLVFFRGTLCHLDRRSLPRRGDWQLDHYADW